MRAMLGAMLILRLTYATDKDTNLSRQIAGPPSVNAGCSACVKVTITVFVLVKMK